MIHVFEAFAELGCAKFARLDLSILILAVELNSPGEMLPPPRLIDRSFTQRYLVDLELDRSEQMISKLGWWRIHRGRSESNVS
jgi:hypothetical protein